MTTVTEVSYSTDALAGAHQALADVIDGGAAAGSVKIYTTDDTLLAEIPLSDPCGTVNAGTGKLTFSIAGTDAALADGEAEYGDICDSDDNVHIRMPVQEGGSAVSGYLVLNAVNILTGATVSISSASLG